MSQKNVKNIAASIRQRLLNLSHKTGEQFDLTLTRYALERLLYRLGNSEWRDKFLLKGALLFSIWRNAPHRPTRDADFLGFDDPDIAKLENIFRSLCAMKSDDDGLEFDPDSVSGKEIRENNAYQGIRIKLQARLEQARISLQCDIGFGDVVTPDAVSIEFPVLLDHEPPQVKAYPVYSVVAEKFQAMVDLGITNSRMKDFYDIYTLSRSFEFDGLILCEAIQKTFKRRSTKLPQDLPVAFRVEFFEDQNKNRQWQAFLKRNRLEGPEKLADVVEVLRQFIMPPVSALHDGEYLKVWKPGAGWD